MASLARGGTAPAYWKFESGPLQRGVVCEPDFGQLYVYRRKPTNASRKLWLGQDGAGLRKMRHRGVLKVDW
jgi:hypothetical protein